MKPNTSKLRAIATSICLGFALLTFANSAFAQFSVLQLTAPTSGSTFAPGQPITVSWTGGDPSWLINVLVIDVQYNQVVSGVPGLLPNNGTASYTFSANMNPCGRVYEFYIQDVPVTNWTYGDTFTIVCQIPVAIEIKPGGSPAPINAGGNGMIPVALLSSSTFDTTTAVDRSSLTFGATGDEPSLAFCDAGGQDVNGDGLPDLVCHFKTQQTGFQSGNTVGVLKGKVVVTGVTVVGTAAVQIVP